VKQEVPIFSRLLSALLAGASAFALAGGGLLLLAGPFDGWIVLALFAAVPAAVIALLPFSARIFCFFLGVIALTGTAFMDLRGADNPMTLLPWIMICLAGAAVVAELSVRSLRRLLGPKAADAEA
jgi:hypothetical protein